MVHSICIYVRLFVFISLFLFSFLIYATACWLPKPVLFKRSQLDWIYSWMENLELLLDLLLVFFAFLFIRVYFFFLNIFPIEVNVLVKPCEMVTWPHVCYDVILKVNLLLNLVMNCTLIVMAENLKSGRYRSSIQSSDAFFFCLFLFFKGKPWRDFYAAHWIFSLN